MDNIDLQKEIERLREVVEENNSILKKMNRANMWSHVFRFIYWSVVIIAGVGAWYVLQPFFNSLLDSYQAVMNSVGKIQQAGDQIKQIGGVLPDATVLQKLLGR